MSGVHAARGTFPGSTTVRCEGYADACIAGLGNTGIINAVCSAGKRVVVSMSPRDSGKGSARTSSVCRASVVSAPGGDVVLSDYIMAPGVLSLSAHTGRTSGYAPLFPSGPYGGKGTVAGPGVVSGSRRFAVSGSSVAPSAPVAFLCHASSGLARVVVLSFT